jgi:hypothetical protein
MAKKLTISNLKNFAANIRRVTPWDDIEINSVYHIPPLITLERRDVIIVNKNENTATYRRVGDKDKTDHTMFRTSVFAKFLVKQKKY